MGIMELATYISGHIWVKTKRLLLISPRICLRYIDIYIGDTIIWQEPCADELIDEAERPLACSWWLQMD